MNRTVSLSFLALALLPWGKFLHPLASPANLLARGGRRDSGFPATALGRNLALEACTRCGLCVRICPMGSITPEDPSSVPGICIKCCACVKECPVGAKAFTDPGFLSHLAQLEANYQAPKAPEWYL